MISVYTLSLVPVSIGEDNKWHQRIRYVSRPFVHWRRQQMHCMYTGICIKTQYNEVKVNPPVCLNLRNRSRRPLVWYSLQKQNITNKRLFSGYKIKLAGYKQSNNQLYLYTILIGKEKVNEQTKASFCTWIIVKSETLIYFDVRKDLSFDIVN